MRSSGSEGLDIRDQGIEVNAAQRQFVNFVKSRKPKKIQDLRGGRYIFRPIGSGAFRDAYAVWTKSSRDLKTVIKMPIDREGHSHACCEMQAINKILTTNKLLPLRRYIPEIFYYGPMTGVIIVRRYNKIPWSFAFYGFVTAFTDLLNDLLPQMRYRFDDGNANFGITKSGDYILLDAGLLGEER